MKALKLALVGAVAAPALMAVVLGPVFLMVVSGWHPAACLLGATAWTGALLGLLVWITEKYPVAR